MKKCIFLGYSGTNQYRIWDPTTKSIQIVKDIIFDKSNIISNLEEIQIDLEDLSNQSSEKIIIDQSQDQLSPESDKTPPL